MNVLKIGIILNYTSAEKKKDELLSCKKYPWLKRGLEKKYSKFTIKRKGVKHVPADVAIGLYIEHHYKNVKVDYITPDKISIRRFKQNDIVFTVIYDLLEAFHLSNKGKFNRFKRTLKACNNVYPPYKYQKFINHKCHYYSYMHKKGIPVAPTYCVGKSKLLSKKNYSVKLLEKMKNNGWEKLIAKPVYGQESIGFSKFTISQPKKLENYLHKNVPKYGTIVLQEYIPGFDKNNPEFRIFYINGKYSYCMMTTSTAVEAPVQEGGKYKLPQAKYKYLKKMSQKIINSLPKLKFGNTSKKPILTRIDIGSGLEGYKYTYFLNELEFVPSLYIEDQKYPVIENMSDELVKTGMYYKKCRTRSRKCPIQTVF